MPLHPDVRSLLDLMEAMGTKPVETQDPDSARADRAALAPPPTHDCAEIRDVDAGGVPARDPARVAVGGDSAGARTAHALAAEAIAGALSPPGA